MQRNQYTWVYLTVIVLAAISVTIAGLHSHNRRNATFLDDNVSNSATAMASDPNAPDPEAGVPTMELEASH